MSELIRAYERWVRREQTWYLPLFDTARSFALLAPGVLEVSPLRREAVYTTLSLLSDYHASITFKPSQFAVPLKCGPRSLPSTVAQRTLRFFRYSETLIEMAANFERPGDTDAVRHRRKWAVIAIVELIKCVCRLFLLYNNSGRMLLPMSQAELEQRWNEKKSELFEDELKRTAVLPDDGDSDGENGVAAGNVNGDGDASTALVTASGSTAVRTLRPLSTMAPEAREYDDLCAMYIARGRAGQPHGRFTPLPMHSRLMASYQPSQREIAAEVLYLVRPVVYVLHRFATAHDSWHPWFSSLAFDVASRACQLPLAMLSAEEQAELNSRTVQWCFYLFRSPFFERFTEYPMVRLSQLVQYVPLFGMFFSNIIDLLLTLRKFYFYTSASSTP